MTFFVEGHPVSKARPRTFTDRSGRSRTFTPQKTRDWEETIAWEVRRQLDHGVLAHIPFEKRVLIDATFRMRKPSSYPKKVVHHLRKPDLDNLVKSLLDGLERGGVIKNDSVITDLHTRKRYADQGQPEGIEFAIHADL